MYARLELHLVIAEGMILGHNCIQSGWNVLAAMTRHTIREKCERHIPLETAVLHNIFDWTRRVGMTNSHVPDERPNIIVWENGCHLRHKWILTMLMVVMASTCTVPQRMKQTVVVQLPMIYA